MPILDMAFDENYKNLGYPFYIVLTTNKVSTEKDIDWENWEEIPF